MFSFLVKKQSHITIFVKLIWVSILGFTVAAILKTSKNYQNRQIIVSSLWVFIKMSRILFSETSKQTNCLVLTLRHKGTCFGCYLLVFGSCVFVSNENCASYFRSQEMVSVWTAQWTNICEPPSKCNVL